MKSFKIKCANLITEIFCKYDSTVDHCSRYLVENDLQADISILPEEEEYEQVKNYLREATCEEVELTVISYMLADAMIEHNLAVIHGSAISYKGEGVIFTAKSGVGKTTHSILWRKVFGRDVSIVNGDKPVVSVRNDKVYVSGSPFCGKEGLSEDITVPLKAICFVERGEENSIEEMSSSDAVSRIFNQLFIPRVGSELMSKAFGIADAIVRNTEFYLLRCNMTEEAPRLAQGKIFGEKHRRKDYEA